MFTLVYTYGWYMVHIICSTQDFVLCSEMKWKARKLGKDHLRMHGCWMRLERRDHGKCHFSCVILHVL